MTRITTMLGLCAAALAAASGAAAADNVEIRIATLAPSGSQWMAVLDAGAAEIKKTTEGRVTIKYFEGGQQGDEKDFVRKVNLGQLDGAAVTSVGLSMIEPAIRVLEVPQMFKSEDEVDYVSDKMWPYFQKKFEAKGFKLSDRGDVGWIYVLSKQKVDSLGDLKGQKIWQWGDDALVGALFRQLGLNGVPLGVPEVDSALTSGRINAAYGSPYAAVALQWHTKIKYMTSAPISFAISATVISLKSFQKIKPEDQKAIETINRANGRKLRKTIRKANEDAKSTMAKQGVTITQTSQATVNELTKVSAAVQQELIGKVYSKEELEMALKFRDEFRAKKGGGATPAK